MRTFTVVFEKDGERFATYTVYAIDEAAARSACEASFRDNPEYDPRRKMPDLTIRVEKTDPPFR